LFFAKKKEVAPLSYTLADASSFLEKHDLRNGYTLGKILKLMISLREEMGMGRIFVGSRKLCNLFFDREGINLRSKEILRCLRKLSDLGYQSNLERPGLSGGRRTSTYC
jgi:hypothetical protein